MKESLKKYHREYLKKRYDSRIEKVKNTLGNIGLRNEELAGFHKSEQEDSISSVATK